MKSARSCATITASSLLLEAEQLAPEDTWITNRIGWAYFNQEKYNEALAYATRTLEIDPTAYRAYGLRGKVHLARLEPAGAAAAYGKLLELRPYDLISLTELYKLARQAHKSQDWGPCFERAGRVEAALDQFSLDSQALSTQGFTVQTWMLRSECEHRVITTANPIALVDKMGQSMRESAQGQGLIAERPKTILRFHRRPETNGSSRCRRSHRE
ncbi:MAG: tetratricopeptide repeat protein [Halioglobus sp.]|nr:tetratricopeptide repeat protein [Halioglobus sp.]